MKEWQCGWSFPSPCPALLPVMGSHSTLSFHAIVAAVLSSLAGGTLGYTTGIINPALDLVEDRFRLSTIMKSVVTCSILVGAMFGSLFGGSAADWVGRRKVSIFAGVIGVIGSVGAAIAPHVVMVVIFRCLLGVGVGLGSFLMPLYVSEVVPAAGRGVWGSVFQWAVTLGILIAYSVGLGLHGVTNGWRWMILLGVVFSAAQLVVSVLYQAESPRWCLAKGRTEEAKRILVDVFGSEERADEEIQKIQESQGQEEAPWGALFSRVWQRPLKLGILLCAAQQLTGVNAIIYYSPRIMESVGFGSDDSLVTTVGIGAWNFVTTIVVFFVVDKKGRRPLMIWSAVLMAVSLLLLSSGYYWFRDHIGPVALICLFVYILGFELGPGPLFFLIVSEIFPQELRGRATGFITLLVWTCNLAISLTFLTLVDWAGEGTTFGIYGLIALVCLIFITTSLPETKGHTLEEIMVLMRSDVSRRQVLGEEEAVGKDPLLETPRVQ